MRPGQLISLNGFQPFVLIPRPVRRHAENVKPFAVIFGIDADDIRVLHPMIRIGRQPTRRIVLQLYIAGIPLDIVQGPVGRQAGGISKKNNAERGLIGPPPLF